MFFQVRRKYSCTDAELLVAANLMYANFLVRHAFFALLNGTVFVPGFAATFRDLIDQAFGIGRHADVRHEITKDTKEVKKARARAVAAFEILGFDVKEAWPDDDAAQNTFGIIGYGKITNGPAGALIHFLKNEIPLIEQHRPALQAAGYTAEKEQEFVAAVEALEQAKLTQGEAIGTRHVKTGGRIRLMNAVYATMAKISDAAARVFKDQPDIVKMFELPKAAKPAKKAATKAAAPAKQ